LWPGRPGQRIRKQENPVDVIRHDYKGIQHHIFEMIWKLAPTHFYRGANGVALHLFFRNMTKNTLTISSADGYELSPGP
jgi:hypothetical protein